MSWTYSGDPSSTPLDEVRYLIGDNDVNAPQLQNEEIEYHLTAHGGNALMAAIDACEGLVAKYARMVTREVGDLRVEAEKLMGHYATLRKRLAQRQGRTSAGVFIGNDKQQRLFKVGMMDDGLDTSYDRPS